METQTPTIPEALLKKIKGLLQMHEKGTSGISANPEHDLREAEAAMAKVQEILMKYNLDLETVRKANDAPKDPFKREGINIETIKTEGKWVECLWSSMAEVNMCTVIISNSSRSKYSYVFWVMGKKHNIEMVIYLCLWLMPKLRTMAKETFRYYEARGGYTKRNSFIRAYLDGAVQGIYGKMKEQGRTFTQHNPQFGLVLVSHKAELMAFEVEQFPDAKQARGTSYSGVDAGAIGMKHGRELEINRPLNTGGTGPGHKMLG